MRRIVWADEAIENLEAVGDYISGFNPFAAKRLTRELIDAAESLTIFPGRGRPVGLTRRDLPIVKPYLIRYAVTADAVYILKVRHMAQRPEW